MSTEGEDVPNPSVISVEEAVTKLRRMRKQKSLLSQREGQRLRKKIHDLEQLVMRQEEMLVGLQHRRARQIFLQGEEVAKGKQQWDTASTSAGNLWDAALKKVLVAVRLGHMVVVTETLDQQLRFVTLPVPRSCKEIEAQGVKEEKQT